MKFLANALKDTDKRQHEGFHPLELAEGLASLAANDSNKTTVSTTVIVTIMITVERFTYHMHTVNMHVLHDRS